MKTIKLAIKGIFLWITAIIFILSICINNVSFLTLLSIIAINTLFISICIAFINKREFIILSGYYWFNNLINIK